LADVDPGWAALIRSCQAQDPAARPHAAAVVEWIAQGPDESFAWHEGLAPSSVPEPSVVAVVDPGSLDDDGSRPAVVATIDEPGPESTDGVPETRRPVGRALAVAAVVLSLTAGTVAAVSFASGAGSAEFPAAPSSPSAEPSAGEGDRSPDTTTPGGPAARPVSPGWGTTPSTSTPTAEPSGDVTDPTTTDTSAPTAPATTITPGSPLSTPTQESQSPALPQASAPPATPTSAPEAPTPAPPVGQ
jgi:hypothetical protein